MSDEEQRDVDLILGQGKLKAQNWLFCMVPMSGIRVRRLRLQGARRGSLANRLPLLSGVLAHERGFSARLLASCGDGGIVKVGAGQGPDTRPGLRGSAARPTRGRSPAVRANDCAAGCWRT